MSVHKKRAAVPFAEKETAAGWNMAKSGGGQTLPALAFQNAATLSFLSLIYCARVIDVTLRIV
ncbi:hypothetical protein Fuma_00434 [Fuerstiella marisgermanici]|uniref:Uncharacterized protein n=1 Tax=Fuerstiella marisgermanici TaxID=1891926 RepID=A0A1P8W9X1_9PLAN|nr:hypothetical protein Fuma_00434 [Fuerstiella marisgermanici]